MTTSTTQAIATQNAAPVDSVNLKDLRPMNTVIIYGIPGDNITVDTTSSSYIYQKGIDNLQSTSLQLDTEGIGRVFIYSPAISDPDKNQKDFASFAVVRADSDDNLITVPLVFGGYSESAQASVFVAYNFTTRAPADGETACSVYLMADPGTLAPDSNGQKYIRIKVDHGAFIVGHEEHHGQWADIPLSDDTGCATIHVTNTTVGKVNVTLTAPDSWTNDEARFAIHFLSIPGAK